METRAIPGPWPVTERLLVCASGSPFSEKLIRTTRRLADELKAQWYTVYIETPSLARQQQENRERVWRDLRLAESLGAEVVTITASSVAEAIIDYAVRHNVTRIVVGKPTKSRWRELFRPPIVDQIIRLSGAIHVHVVSISGAPVKPGAGSSRRRQAIPWFGYLASLALVAATTLLSSSGRALSVADQYGHDLSAGGRAGRRPARSATGDSHRRPRGAGLRFLFYPAPLDALRWPIPSMSSPFSGSSSSGW